MPYNQFWFNNKVNGSNPIIVSIEALWTGVIKVIFNKPVNVTTAGWSFSKGVNLSIGDITGDGDTWVFYTVSFSDIDILTVSYNATTGNTLDLDGNKLKTITNESITNLYVIGDSEFKMTIKTDNVGSTTDLQFQLPPAPGLIYNYTVDWGDGNIPINYINDSFVIYDYSIAGIYQIKITGAFPGINFDSIGDRRKVLSIDNWGTGKWENLTRGFQGCTNLVGNFTDIPDLSLCTSLSACFSACPNYNIAMDYWNTRTCTNITYLLNGCSTFNSNIRYWITTGCTSLEGVFSSCSIFNKSLQTWKLKSNMTNISFCFFECFAYNQSVSNLGKYLNNVTTYENCFGNCTVFNQPLITWTCQSAIIFTDFFQFCTNFAQEVNHFQTSNVTHTIRTFYNCKAFNKSWNGWNTSNFLRTDFMLEGCDIYNTTFEDVDLSNVTNCQYMLYGDIAFNQPLPSDFSSCTVYEGMLMYTKYNYPLPVSTMGAAVNISYMLAENLFFTQDISGWSLTNLLNATNLMLSKGNEYPPAYTDAFYNNTSIQTLHPNISLGMGNIKYTLSGQTGKDILTNVPNSWSITDGGI